MNYELIAAEEYDSLPEDDEQCFVQFEAICRASVNRMINENSTRDFDRQVQLQYMAMVSAAALESSIPNISMPEYDDEHFYEIYQSFCVAVQGQIARIRFRQRGFRHPYSVQLLPNTKTKIEHHIAQIREVIKTSDLPGDRQRALGAKLDELVAEIDKSRVGFGKVMAVLGTVLLGLANVTIVAAEGPTAVNAIMKLITLDKETEDAAKLRLAPPQKALPAPPAAKTRAASAGAPSWDAPKGDELDDEIPF
jgi:hypothetical protein